MVVCDLLEKGQLTKKKKKGTPATFKIIILYFILNIYKNKVKT